MKDEQYIQALYEEAVEQAADFAAYDEQRAEIAALHRHYAVQLGNILEIAPAETEEQIAVLTRKLAAVNVAQSMEPQARLQREVDRILDGSVRFSEEEYRHLIGCLAEFEELMDLPLYDILQNTAWQILQALHPQLESYELEGLLMEDVQQILKKQSLG
jgi:hypothetical protein